MSRRLIVWGACVLLLEAMGILAWISLTDWQYRGRALPGVAVAGEPIGGLDGRAIAARVAAIAVPELSRPVIVRAGSLQWAHTAAVLGLRPATDRVVVEALAVGRVGRWDQRLRQRLAMVRRPVEIAIPYEVEPGAVRAAVERMASLVGASAEDALVEVVAGRLVVVRPSRDGLTLDEPATEGRLAAALRDRSSEVELVVQHRPPAFPTEVAARMAEPVATFVTRFTYYPDRIHNIRLAAARLRGVLVPPGGVLSFNQIVGPRDPALGYRKAPVLINNELVPGDGGGVCQVSSTLFNAALLAEMAVEARTNHSRPVPYLAAGRDATVDYGAIDLRFRNTSGRPMMVWTEVGARTLTVTIFGEPRPGREVAVVVADPVVIAAPGHTVVRADPELPAGRTRIEPARSGLRVRTVRIVRQDGVVVSQETVAVSAYQPVPRTIKIGTGAPVRPPVRRAAAP